MESNQGGSFLVNGSDTINTDVQKLKEELALAMQSLEILNKDLMHQKYLVSENESEIDNLQNENNILKGFSELKMQSKDFGINFESHLF